jgi:ankyrin repeat protein
MTAMLTRGVDINHKKNSNEETPLHYAVSKGALNNARFLLDNGADINAKSR